LLKIIQHTHGNKRTRLFFQDEARIGQKGRTCHIWWKRGQRPPGLCDHRFTFAYIFAAVEPGLRALKQEEIFVTRLAWISQT
jgi:hypothetical protein